MGRNLTHFQLPLSLAICFPRLKGGQTFAFNRGPMKTIRTPATILGLFYACFLLCLAWSPAQLPERVATHFDGRGRPNGWMSRSSHLSFITVLGFAFPMSIVGISFALRFMPTSLINIPHREYWLASERRTQTLAYIFRHSLWFASLAIGFVIGINLLLIHSNNQFPVRLSTPLLLTLLGCFLAGVALWGISAFRYFRRPA
jgi:hypothetical protein